MLAARSCKQRLLARRAALLPHAVPCGSRPWSGSLRPAGFPRRTTFSMMQRSPPSAGRLFRQGMRRGNAKRAGLRSRRCKQRRLGSKLCRLLFVSTNPHPRLEQELIFVVKRLKSFAQTAFSIKSGWENE